MSDYTTSFCYAFSTTASDYTTSFYYAFSTTAQVLAAFLALSGVFLIFKIQEIRKLQISRAKYIHSLLVTMQIVGTDDGDRMRKDIKSLDRMIEAENQDNIISTLQRISVNPYLEKHIHSGHLLSLSENHQLIKEAENKLNNIRNLTKMSMILGCSSTVLSLFILSTIHHINEVTSYIAYTIIFLGAAISIYLMMRSIFKSLQNVDIKIEE